MEWIYFCPLLNVYGEIVCETIDYKKNIINKLVCFVQPIFYDQMSMEGTREQYSSISSAYLERFYYSEYIHILSLRLIFCLLWLMGQLGQQKFQQPENVINQKHQSLCSVHHSKNLFSIWATNLSHRKPINNVITQITDLFIVFLTQMFNLLPAQ